MTAINIQGGAKVPRHWMLNNREVVKGPLRYPVHYDTGLIGEYYRFRRDIYCQGRSFVYIMKKEKTIGLPLVQIHLLDHIQRC